MKEKKADKTDTNFKKMSDGLIDLLSIFEPKQVEIRDALITGQENQLFEACAIIGKYLNVPILKPNFFPKKNETILELLKEIIEASQLRIREVDLTANWWLNDAGPLLAFKRDGKPGALLLKKQGYVWTDSNNGGETPITATIAETLEQKAYQIYKTLPDEPLTWRSLLSFVFSDLKKDMFNILKLQFIAGILALLIPIVTGLIFDNIVPNADLLRLKQVIALLIISTFISSLFGLSQAFYIMRLRFKSNINMETAVWDRLLRLPLPFFRQYIAGDLVNRAAGIDAIQQFITSTMLITVLSGTFSIITLLLMFYYNVWLALASVGLAIIAVLLSVIMNKIQLKYQRPLLNLQGKISGVLFQLISSINKLRVANSENSAFALWSNLFANKNKLFLSAQMNIILFSAFYPIYIAFSTIIFYSLVVFLGNNLSFGTFIAFNAAFGQFFAALLAMASVFNSILMIVPLYERVKPILNAIPELENAGVDPLTIKGNISIQHLNFRYAEELENVLDNINIQIQEKSFIALFGPTGSGKSTLCKIILGFEPTKKNTCFYDDYDITHLNKRALRKQIGFVSQNSQIFPGSIYDNITSFSSHLRLEDAENAATMVGILDEIKAMPMGMHTLISEGAKNISVGQRQRIMLARVIIQQPKILILDEATNALDNNAQALIYKNLAQLPITRIVASHQLSAIKNADHIYVLENGKIKESGNYTELLKKSALFSKLVKEQH